MLTLVTWSRYLPPGPEADDYELWKVVHDDGDAEDLELHEVRALLGVLTLTARDDGTPTPTPPPPHTHTTDCDASTPGAHGVPLAGWLAGWLAEWLSGRCERVSWPAVVHCRPWSRRRRRRRRQRRLPMGSAPGAIWRLGWRDNECYGQRV
jgi:hypothetical protein